jgi:predicted DNA-binding protein
MPITVRLTLHEESRLSSLAERTSRPRFPYVKQALAEYLEDLYLPSRSICVCVPV